MSWLLEKDRLQVFARTVDSSVVLTTKDSWFWKTLGAILSELTFGRMPKEEFLTKFATTIGPVIAFPKEFDVKKAEYLIIHESRHVKQAKWFGFGIHPWLGIFLLTMPFFYLLFPLPIGLAWVRYRLELDADRACWKYMLERGISEIEIFARARSFAQTVSSGKYGWSMPSKWVKWGFTRSAKKLISSYKNS